MTSIGVRTRLVVELAELARTRTGGRCAWCPAPAAFAATLDLAPAGALTADTLTSAEVERRLCARHLERLVPGARRALAVCAGRAIPPGAQDGLRVGFAPLLRRLGVWPELVDGAVFSVVAAPSLTPAARAHGRGRRSPERSTVDVGTER